MLKLRFCPNCRSTECYPFAGCMFECAKCGHEGPKEDFVTGAIKRTSGPNIHACNKMFPPIKP